MALPAEQPLVGYSVSSAKVLDGESFDAGYGIEKSSPISECLCSMCN